MKNSIKTAILEQLIKIFGEEKFKVLKEKFNNSSTGEVEKSKILEKLVQGYISHNENFRQLNRAIEGYKSEGSDFMKDKTVLKQRKQKKIESDILIILRD